MKKIFTLLFLLCLPVFLVSCNSDDNYSSVTDDVTTEYETETETEPIKIELTPADEVTTEETTTEVFNLIIENPFKFEFDHTEDEKIYMLQTKVSGIYRFDFGTDDVECSYKIKLINDINDVIFDTQYSKYNLGKTELLDADRVYKLVITQYVGFPTVEISIGIPNEKFKVKDNKVVEEFRYTDQENTYIFHSNLEGIYRFDFKTNNVDYKYNVVLKDDINNPIFDSKCDQYNKGEGVKLKANTDYKLIVAQNIGLPEYKIIIHEPNKPEIVKGSFSGKISFKNQENIYYYTPIESGEYQIKLTTSDKKCSCDLSVYDNINTHLFTTSYEYPQKVNLEKNITYKFIVDYHNGYLDYDVNIEKIDEE